MTNFSKFTTVFTTFDIETLYRLKIIMNALGTLRNQESDVTTKLFNLKL